MPEGEADSAIRVETDLERALRRGEITLDGRLVDSSNNALVGAITPDIRCVYKPTAGERPLWDFPDGTLARREVAAYLVAEAAGWGCVPTTVYRDGPFGPGMVQRWVADADPDRVADLLAPHDVPRGWLPVLSAQGPDGEPLIVAHADSAALATIAVFDLVVNNADRKASHLLATADGAVLGVDHGLTFHTEPKLRTILWGWAGKPIDPDILVGVRRLDDSLRPDHPRRLQAALAELLSADEIDALHIRIGALLAGPHFPLPPDDRPAIPWPPL